MLARSGLNLRAGPGTEYAVVAVLQYNQEVSVLDEGAGWLSIDTQHDGAMDGFAFGRFLAAQ